MIDNLISNPTKKFWINLEFDFESYEFFNFLGIFLNFFDFI